MMNKCLLIVVIIFSFLFISKPVNAQSLSVIEKNYAVSKKNLDNANHVLDSLKTVLNKKADEIEIEKSKTNPDEDKIVELMSSFVVISNNYEAQRKKVNQLGKKVDTVVFDLSKKYSSIIDSLRSLGSSDTFNGDKDKLDSEILFYMEKKISVSPKILMLSFDPAKLLKLDLRNTKDSLEAIVYKEYLQNAYKEINNHLENVEHRYSEVSSILLLQKKTEKFLKETEFGNDIPTKNSSTENKTTIVRYGGDDEGTGVVHDAAALPQQYHDYALLLNQINIDLTSGNKLDWQVVPVDGDTPIDLTQYKKMLEDLKKKLLEYKFVLGNRIGNNK